MVNKKNIYLKKIIIFLISLTHYATYAQQIQENDYGINGGVIIALGNKIDRVGIRINAYYIKEHIQLNPELSLYFNFKNLGPKKQYLEGTASLGLVFGYGKHTTDTNLFLSSVSNQTQLKNSIGYSFNYYFNAIHTSQQTGILSFQFNQFNLIAENDLFARPKLDQYRTGALLIQYRHKNTQFGINSTLFTGKMGKKIMDKDYPFSHIYKDTTGGKYAHYSHGLLSAQFQYILPYSQKIQGNIGIDSERVRHIIQNRLLHDLIFLPKPWRRQNSAHIPMLTEDNTPYLFKENQKVKSPHFYYNLFTNPNLFY